MNILQKQKTISFLAFFFAFWIFGSFTCQANEANLKAGVLGPYIKVGIIGFTEDDLSDSYFKIRANKDYKITDCRGTQIAIIDKDTYTKARYAGDEKLRIYNSISDKYLEDKVCFVAADKNNTDLIFEINKPDSDYDHYRGRIYLDYYDGPEKNDAKIWVVNRLPLEHYVWGMGEITGTGDMDYNRLMTSVFRTYGYWKIKFSTKYDGQGFDVDATPGNQIYRGYDWETKYTRIKTAAQYTQGKLVMYNDEIALVPYSSWTDGRTRSFEERWGSDDYPWCQSVKDPYGNYNIFNNPDKSTATLVAEGNHMVGISAHGAVHLAGEHDWSWSKILQYYLDDISLYKAY